MLIVDEPSLGLRTPLVKGNVSGIRRVNESGVAILMVKQTLAFAYHGYVELQG